MIGGRNEKRKKKREEEEEEKEKKASHKTERVAHSYSYFSYYILHFLKSSIYYICMNLNDLKTFI
jgi:hypothetical protein